MNMSVLSRLFLVLLSLAAKTRGSHLLVPQNLGIDHPCSGRYSSIVNADTKKKHRMQNGPLAIAPQFITIRVQRGGM